MGSRSAFLAAKGHDRLSHSAGQAAETSRAKRIRGGQGAAARKSQPVSDVRALAALQRRYVCDPGRGRRRLRAQADELSLALCDLWLKAPKLPRTAAETRRAEPA